MSDRIAGSRPNGAFKRGTAAVVLAGALLVAQGCYHYRAVPVQPAAEDEVGGAPALATEYEGETVWALLWGLVQERPDISNCEGEALAEVRVTTNLGYALLTVVTLGFASPARVQWRCAKPTPTPVPIGVPDSAARPSPTEDPMPDVFTGHPCRSENAEGGEPAARGAP